MQHYNNILSESIFGFDNKITIIKFIKNIEITYNVCTNEQKEFRKNSIILHNGSSIDAFKYMIVSPKCEQILHVNLETFLEKQ